MYNTILDPALRPTIVLLLGETGDRVYDHLMHLTPTLDPVMHPALAVLRYAPEHAGPSERLRTVPADADDDADIEGQAGRYDPATFATNAEDERVLAQGTFADLMVRAVCDVQDVRVIERLRRAGFAVPDPMAQIVVVGRADDVYLEEALRAVRAALAEARHALGAMIDLEAPILGALADYRISTREFTNHARVSRHDRKPALDPNLALHELYLGTRGRDRESARPSATNLRDSMGADGVASELKPLPLPSANFLFLYSRMRQDHRATMDENLIDYIMAEAIFALCATGLALSPSMGEVSRPLPGISATKDRLGSLGACMVRFPQVEALRYCVATLGAEVLTQWSHQELADKREHMDADARAAWRDELHASAMRFVEETLLPWLRYDLLADFPDAGAEGWPGLDAFAEPTRQAGEALARTRDRLDPLISREEIEHHLATRDPDHRMRRRPEDFAQMWDDVTTQAWLEFTDQQQTQLAAVLRVAYLAIGTELDRFLDRHVDDLWLDPDYGWEAAGEYVEAMADALYAVAVQTLTDDRIAADARHEALLRRYEDLTSNVGREGADAAESMVTYAAYAIDDPRMAGPFASAPVGAPAVANPIDTGTAGVDATHGYDEGLGRGVDTSVDTDPDATIISPFTPPHGLAPALGAPGVSEEVNVAIDQPEAERADADSFQAYEPYAPYAPYAYDDPNNQGGLVSMPDVVDVPATEAREESLLHAMSLLVEKRLREQEMVMPSIGMSLVAAPALILLALAQATRWWSFSLGLVGAVTVLVLAVLAGLILVFWRLACRRTRQALDEHIALMSAIAARRTELVEEQLRLCVVNQALANARDMREHLREWPDRIERMANQYRDEAQRTSDDLFSGPAGYHDVLIANGARLMPPDVPEMRPAGSVPRPDRSPLWPIYLRFTTDRAQHPAERWHSSLDGIVDALREQFRGGRGGVIRMSEGNFRALVRRFLRDHFHDYLRPEVGNLAAALDPEVNPSAMQQWTEAFEHAIPPHSQPGADLVSVAGQRVDLLTSKTVGGERKLYRLLTRPSDRHKTWLLATTLRRGGITL